MYAVPLVGPHAAWFLGNALWAQGSSQSAAWTATNIGVAIAAQILVGVALYWSSGGRWVRKLVWLGAVPLVAGLNVAYLSAIPAIFLGLHAAVSLIRAYVFMLLAMIYLSGAVSHEH